LPSEDIWQCLGTFLIVVEGFVLAGVLSASSG
jgi:hypothetical protein